MNQEEVELRLRSSLAVHQATEDEINFRCSKSRSIYAEVVRWNTMGSFTYLFKFCAAVCRLGFSLSKMF